MTLTGANFLDVSSVTLGFVSASYTVNSPTSITAAVPSGAPYGRWRVSTPAGTAVNTDVYTVSPVNADFDFAPLVGPRGSTVTLSGPNLGGATAVTLGFAPASFTVNSPTSITATVPSGVEYGRWRVSTPGGTLVNDLIYSVAPTTIASFGPIGGGTGSTVTLTGTNFTSVGSVTLGFVPASYTVNSSTSITATVPAGVAYGRWRVTTPAGTAVNNEIFTVTS